MALIEMQVALQVCFIACAAQAVLPDGIFSLYDMSGNFLANRVCCSSPPLAQLLLITRRRAMNHPARAAGLAFDAP